MSQIDSSISPQAFFLRTRERNLYCLYYPAVSGPGDRAVLYVPPFADEMHCARDFVTRIAWELSQHGCSVLMLDLFGTGDSDGDFGEARWETWQADLDAASLWLGQRGHHKLTLWGVRLGAMLAMEAASRAQKNLDIDRVVLWQPVLEGERMLTQFFRMHLAVEDDSGERLRQALGDHNLRRALAYGDSLQVAGFTLSPVLIRAIDRLHLQPLGAAISAPIHWLEVLHGASRDVPAETSQVLDQWRTSGRAVMLHQSTIWPFWHFAHSVDPQPLMPELLPMFGIGAL